MISSAVCRCLARVLPPACESELRPQRLDQVLEGRSLTLLAIPTAYEILSELREGFQRRFRRQADREAAPALAAGEG